MTGRPYRLWPDEQFTIRHRRFGQKPELSTFVGPQNAQGHHNRADNLRYRRRLNHHYTKHRGGSANGAADRFEVHSVTPPSVVSASTIVLIDRRYGRRRRQSH